MTARSPLAYRLADLAFDMDLSFPETVALPTVVEVLQKRLAWTAMGVVIELEQNMGLRDYTKTLCTKGAEAL